MNAQHLKRLSAPWPGVTDDVKWGDDLIFSVGGKMFCGLCLRGGEQGKLSFKVEPDRFLEFTDRPGFRPAPYMARCHWVTLDDPSIVPAKELDALLRRAYELVRAGLTRKRQREYEALESGAASAPTRPPAKKTLAKKTPAAGSRTGKASKASDAPAATAGVTGKSARPKRAVELPAATVARKSASAGKAAKRVRS